jgi:hypothetical protein
MPRRVCTVVSSIVGPRLQAYSVVRARIPLAANPTFDKVQQCTSAEARRARSDGMSAEQQQQALAWMRIAELKHARLAMLAAAGWPLSELVAGSFLKPITNGRAPSLFNGALFDFPFGFFVLLTFGGLAFLEVTTKDRVTNGDYGFDPLGLSQESATVDLTTLKAKLPEKVAEFRTGPTATIGNSLPDTLPNIGDLRALREQELTHGRSAMSIHAVARTRDERRDADQVLRSRPGVGSRDHRLRGAGGALGQPGRGADALVLWALICADRDRRDAVRGCVWVDRFVVVACFACLCQPNGSGRGERRAGGSRAHSGEVEFDLCLPLKSSRSRTPLAAAPPPSTHPRARLRRPVESPRTGTQWPMAPWSVGTRDLDCGAADRTALRCTALKTLRVKRCS